MRKKFKVVGPDRKSCFAQGKFCKTYNKDEIVTATPKTLGIMVFGSFSRATQFMQANLHKCERIIEVTTIGRGKRPKRISFSPKEERLESFYEGDSSYHNWHPPDGTICYPAVMVLG